MKRLISWVTILIGMLVPGFVSGGQVEIVNVEVVCSSSCKFSVTLKHGDEGWDHYANQWDVMTMDGKLLKSRVLYHPHVDEQPFTRSGGPIPVRSHLTVACKHHLAGDPQPDRLPGQPLVGHVSDRIGTRIADPAQAPSAPIYSGR